PGAGRRAQAVRHPDRPRFDEFDQVGHRALARRRRRGGIDLLHPRPARPGGPAHAQSRQSVRWLRRRGPGAAPGQAARNPCHAQQQLRFRRDQRQPRDQAGRLSGRPERSTMIRKTVLVPAVMLLALLVMVVGSTWTWWGASAVEEETEFVVPSGSSVTSVGEKLAREGLIASADSFLLFARLLGGNDPIKAGEFLIPAGASPSDILDTL